MPQPLKRRSLLILALVALGLIVTIIVTSRFDSIAATVEKPLLYVISPIQRAFYTVSSKVDSFLDEVLEKRNLKRENEELSELVESLEKELLDRNELEKENERLKRLLGFAQDNDKIAVTGAKVIGKNPGNWFNIILLNKGTKDNVDVNMAVVTERGLVGRIFQVGPNWAKVRTVVDGQSSVSGIIERTRDNGLIKGSSGMDSDDGMCKMIYLPLDTDLELDDKVLTSGLGDIFPKGIYIGKVLEIKDEERDIYKTAIIEPGVDFERLEEVLIIKSSIWRIDTFESRGN
ncbi:MAG: rod shape-determining protein MreC [Clostridiales bacterium]|nr:rod shape-determining protein MreC [Clostridiales bacterium]